MLARRDGDRLRVAPVSGLPNARRNHEPTTAETMSQDEWKPKKIMGMMNGIRIAKHVHDELITKVPSDQFSRKNCEALNKAMMFVAREPEWTRPLEEVAYVHEAVNHAINEVLSDIPGKRRSTLHERLMAEMEEVLDERGSRPSRTLLTNMSAKLIGRAPDRTLISRRLLLYFLWSKDVFEEVEGSLRKEFEEAGSVPAYARRRGMPIRHFLREHVDTRNVNVTPLVHALALDAVGDLTELSEAHLLEVEGVGEKTIERVSHGLSKIGLELVPMAEAKRRAMESTFGGRSADGE